MVHHQLPHERITDELETPTIIGDRNRDVRTRDHERSGEWLPRQRVEDGAHDGVARHPLRLERTHITKDEHPRERREEPSCFHGRNPKRVQKRITAQLSPNG